MKTPPPLVITLAAIISIILAACQKIELPDGNEGGGEKTETDGGNDSNNGGNNDTTTPDTDEDYCTVAQAIEADELTTMWVAGYIVGYVNGTRLSQTVFGIPQEKQNTNMLLADSPTETDPNRCLPVMLSTKAAEDYPRERLNMFTHPENYKAKIAIFGTIETYFTVNGIKVIADYEWLAPASNTGQEPAPDDGDDEEPLPPTPGGDQTAPAEPPTISDEDPAIVQGR